MTEILKTIDWTQVGPFTALLLICAIMGLCIAPFAFRYLGKRSDVDAEDRKRQSDREAEKDRALLRFIEITGASVEKMTESIEKIGGKITGSEVRILDRVDRVETKVTMEIGKLRDDLDDKRQNEILGALRDPKVPEPNRSRPA